MLLFLLCILVWIKMCENTVFKNFTETSQEKSALLFWNETSVVAAKGDILENIWQVSLKQR